MEGNDTITPTSRPTLDAVFALGLVSLVLVAASWGTLWVMRTSRDKQLHVYTKQASELDAESARLTDVEITYQALETVSRNASKARAQRFLFGPVWESLKASVPNDVRFTSLVLGTDSTVRIIGISRSVDAVAQFARTLESQKGVAMVTPLQIEKGSSSANMTFSLTFKVSQGQT